MPFYEPTFELVDGQFSELDSYLLRSESVKTILERMHNIFTDDNTRGYIPDNIRRQLLPFLKFFRIVHCGPLSKTLLELFTLAPGQKHKSFIYKDKKNDTSLSDHMRRQIDLAVQVMYAMLYGREKISEEVFTKTQLLEVLKKMTATFTPLVKSVDDPFYIFMLKNMKWCCYGQTCRLKDNHRGCNVDLDLVGKHITFRCYHDGYLTPQDRITAILQIPDVKSMVESGNCAVVEQPEEEWLKHCQLE